MSRIDQIISELEAGCKISDSDATFLMEKSGMLLGCPWDATSSTDVAECPYSVKTEDGYTCAYCDDFICEN